MNGAGVHFSSMRLDWKTPKAFYDKLDTEFNFTFDPCPPNQTFDGLNIEWGGLISLIHRTVGKYQNGLRRATKNILKERP